MCFHTYVLYFAAKLSCDASNGWTFANNYCLKYNLTGMNWFEARETCKAEGSDLIKIADDHRVNASARHWYWTKSDSDQDRPN